MVAPGQVPLMRTVACTSVADTEYERTRALVRRHVSLLDLLLSGRWIGREEIAGRDDDYAALLSRESGDRRTLPSDLERLRQLEFAISELRPDGRQRRTTQYQAAQRTAPMDVAYSDAEIAALELVRSVVSIAYDLDDTAIASIAAVSLPDTVATLAAALQHRVVVAITYRGRTRDLHPYALAIGDLGRWFVGGWAGEGVRTFPVDELDDVHPTTHEYSAADDRDIEVAQQTNALLWHVDDLETVATVRLSEEATHEACEDFGRSAPGIATVHTRHIAELYRRLATHWPVAELIGPEALRADFIRHLERLAGEA